MTFWTQALPPSQRMHQAANALLALIQPWDARASAGLFDASVDATDTQRLLARLAVEHGACTVEQPLQSDGKGKGTLRLACAHAPLELSFGFDERSGRVTSVTGSAPAERGAPCKG